jgi:hypothetical protein
MIADSFMIVTSIINNDDQKFLLIYEEYKDMKREIDQLSDCLVAGGFDFQFSILKNRFIVGNVTIVFAVSNTFSSYGFGKEYLQIKINRGE